MYFQPICESAQEDSIIKNNSKIVLQKSFKETLEGLLHVLQSKPRIKYNSLEVLKGWKNEVNKMSK